MQQGEGGFICKMTRCNNKEVNWIEFVYSFWFLLDGQSAKVVATPTSRFAVMSFLSCRRERKEPKWPNFWFDFFQPNQTFGNQENKQTKHLTDWLTCRDYARRADSLPLMNQGDFFIPHETDSALLECLSTWKKALCPLGTILYCLRLLLKFQTSFIHIPDF